MRYAKGYSLIEFMVSLVIALLFSVVMMTLFSSLTHQGNAVKDVTDISKNSRTSLFLMARDIANAGYMLNCVGNGCGGILTTPNVCPVTGAAPPCPVLSYAESPSVITLNYAALSPNDPLQIEYSLVGSALHRKELRPNSPGNTADDNEIADNVMAMVFKFGMDAGGIGEVSYWDNLDTMTFSNPVRSIKVALLTRSALPDKKYTSPNTITWLGGDYSVPTDPDLSHYRFKVIQQEVFLLNTTILNP